MNVIKTGRSAKTAVISLLLTIVLIILVFSGMSVISHLEEKIEEKSYPVEYMEYVEKYSQMYDVKPELVLAVIYCESSFRPTVVSKSGAVGLMQIKPTTFADLQGRLGESYDDSALEDPEINIKYGTYYLNYLYNIFYDWEIVVAAYNAGPTRVMGWLEDDEITKDGKLVNIPYSETAEYVKRVFAAVDKYYELIYSEV